MARKYPGALQRDSAAMVMAEGLYLTSEDLDLSFLQKPQPTMSLREARQKIEADLIMHLLAAYHGDLSRVAKELKISRPTLYGLLRKHGIQEKAARIKSIVQGD